MNTKWHQKKYDSLQNEDELKEDKEKVEMEKATNSKMEFLKSLETENASTSVTREVINDMKKRYENMPTTSLKEVMGWLIEDKEVVYRFINPGEVDEWLKVDPKHPILAEQYEYQLAEKIQETWSFRIPEYSIKASCREEARKKAFEMIMKDPSYIVVYPGEHDNVI